MYSFSSAKFYKGSTHNITDRLRRHNAGTEKATKNAIPWILVWTVSKPTKAEAIQLEYKLKNLSVLRTIQFIEKYKEGIVAGPDELLAIKQLSGC